MRPVIFITGATSGFGAATARRFAANGWNVVATGRRLERLESLQAEFAPGVVHISQMDLTDRKSIAATLDGLPEGFKPIKCLFNNGGLALGTLPVPDASAEDWRQMAETNMMGLVHMTMDAIPLLKQAGRGTSIINVGSVAGNYAYRGGNFYGASKAFVRQFTMNLRTDLAETDIRVTDLAPGLAKSEFTKVRNYGDDEANEKFYEGTEPLLPEDIAETVWWVANLPSHVNINVIEMMATCQTPAGFNIRRN